VGGDHWGRPLISCFSILLHPNSFLVLLRPVFVLSLLLSYSGFCLVSHSLVSSACCVVLSLKQPRGCEGTWKQTDQPDGRVTQHGGCSCCSCCLQACLSPLSCHLLAFARIEAKLLTAVSRRSLPYLAASLTRPSVAAAVLASSNAASRVRGFSSSAADGRRRRVGDGLLKTRAHARAFQSYASPTGPGQKKTPSFAFAFESVIYP